MQARIGVVVKISHRLGIKENQGRTEDNSEPDQAGRGLSSVVGVLFTHNKPLYIA